MRFKKQVLAWVLAIVLAGSSLSTVMVSASDDPVTGISIEEGTEETVASTEDEVTEDQEEPTEAEAMSETDAAEAPDEDGADISEASTETGDAEIQDKLEETEASAETEIAEEEEADESAVAEEAPSETEDTEAQEEIEEVLSLIGVNTGDHVRLVTDWETYLQTGVGEDLFNDDGSYTIYLETDAFFPYEVQFTCGEETTNVWFMTPSDTVEIGGHTFGVYSYTTGTAVTQMSLEIGGNTVVVYPEEKEFTDSDNGGISVASLLPLESVSLTVDLTGYSPLELTGVKFSSVFTGENELSDSDVIAWKYASSSYDDYTISTVGDTIDLSWGTYYGSGTSWEMIVGDGDQLNADNIRYTVSVSATASRTWMTSVLSAGSSLTTASSLEASTNYYSDWYYERPMESGITTYSREVYTTYSYTALGEDTLYGALSVDTSLFGNTSLASWKFVSGSYTTAAEAATAEDITSVIQSGQEIDSQYWGQEITMIGYDASGNVLGVLPFEWYLYGSSDMVILYLYDGSTRVSSSGWGISTSGQNQRVNISLYSGYATNGKYALKMYYSSNGSGYSIEKVYQGQYTSASAAEKAGATDISAQVVYTSSASSVSGYSADYSDGVWFTIISSNGEEQAVSTVCITTVEGASTTESSGSTLSITGLIDSAGETVTSYVISSTDDSYAEANYITILVGYDVDLSKAYAPTFAVSDKATVYTSGSSEPEVSGVTMHSFADGAIQYTVSAENGKNSKNYWVQVVNVGSEYGSLYISSLEDEDAETTVSDEGVVYSIREVMLDAYHYYYHDILLVNLGLKDLENLSVELDSDVVELDEYWTLSGAQTLAGMETIYTAYSEDGTSGEQPNMAKLRLRAKDSVEDGTEVSGTLTIKSNGVTIMVLTLTGTVGDPTITTTEIPDAVKYVPYGTMIQNSNKYSWIETSYSLVYGELPEGMIIKPNGELYGVPQETGTFTFGVQVTFTSTKEAYSFSSKYATLTLTVKENTNENVYTASDEGYALLTPIGEEVATYDFYLETIEDSLFVSEGVYGEFIDLWLNGEKLTDGTDYTSESGSTRITVSAQTLRNKANTTGVNTIAAEFRVEGDENQELKRTAQNFRLESTEEESTGTSGVSGSNGSVSGVTLCGYVVDGSYNPMAGVTVEIHSTPKSEVTAANGYFAISNVEFGTHTVYVKDADGNTLASRQLIINEQDAKSLSDDVLTAPNGSTVSVIVVVADGKISYTTALTGSAAATGDSASVLLWTVLMVMALAAAAVIFRSRQKANV